MSSRVHFQKAAINFSNTGDNTVIAADAVSPIFVWRIIATSGGSTALTFKEGSTAVSGAEVFVANGAIYQQYDGAPLYQCNPGDAFVINQSGTASIQGTVWYTKG